MISEEKIIRKAKKAFRYRNLSIFIIIMGVVGIFPIAIMLNKIFHFQNIGLIVVGGYIGALIISSIITSVFWKCPSCRRKFPTRSGHMHKMTHCPYCGVKLRGK